MKRNKVNPNLINNCTKVNDDMIRKYTIAILLLFTVISYSQVEISVRADGMNAVWGSGVNPAGLNWKVGISDSWNYNIPLRFGMEYEAFDMLGYQQWVWAKFDYEIPLSDQMNVYPGVALSQIFHETSYSMDAMSYMFNIEIDYAIFGNFRVSVQFQRQRATDIEQIWRDSAYTGLKYRF